MIWNKVYGGILGGMFLLLPLIGQYYPGLDGCIPMFVVSLACLLLLATRCFPVRGAMCFNVNDIDLCLFMYILYGFIRVLCNGQAMFDPIVVCEWVGIVAVYLVVRGLRDESVRILYYGVVLGGVVQAVIGLFQYFHMIESNSGLFDVTGSFFNPGPWGGFLVVTLVVCLEITRNIRTGTMDGRMKILFVVLGLLIVSSLVLSDSRAAWVALIVWLIYVYWPSVNSTRKNSRFSGYASRVKVVLMVVVVVVISLFYLYKQDSADARLLIWKSSWGMFWDAPVFGHGIGNFSTKYMLYQADYLDLCPGTASSFIADNNLLAFNEFIRLACEQGIVGFTLFFLLLTRITRGMNDSFVCRTGRAGLLVFFIFAFFSYPSSVFALKLFLPVFLGVLGRSGRLVVGWRFNRKVGALSLLLPVFVSGWFVVKTLTMYHEAFGVLHHEVYLKTRGVFREDEACYAYMKHNKCFLCLLSEQFIKDDRIGDALTVKRQLLKIAPSSSLLCDVGNIYLATGEIYLAKKCFEEARRMTPNHILPLYGLLVVNDKLNNRELCMEFANRIINMPVRVVNNMVLRARSDAKKYLQLNR